MEKGCLLYYITDRTAFPGDESSRRRRLLEKICEAARAGVDYIQLREKDLPTRDLELLAKEAVSVIAQLKTENRELRTALLINSRTDVALAVQADGIHLRSHDVSPPDVRTVWQCGAGAPARRNSPSRPLIGVSCHTPPEVAQAAAQNATFAVFAPVFEKNNSPTARPAGLIALAESLRGRHPSPGSRRHHSGQCPFLLGSRSCRYRRHPPISGQRHRTGRARAAQSYPVALSAVEVRPPGTGLMTCGGGCSRRH